MFLSVLLLCDSIKFPSKYIVEVVIEVGMNISAQWNFIEELTVKSVELVEEVMMTISISN